MLKLTNTKEIKSNILSGQLEVIDRQIDKAGRLISKKVVFKDICRQRVFYTEEEYVDFNGRKRKKFNLKSLTAEEQELILFYGLARIHQLSKQTKLKLFNKIKSLHSIDERELCFVIYNSDIYTTERYWSLDTGCRDKVMDLMYLVADSKYTPKYIQF